MTHRNSFENSRFYRAHNAPLPRRRLARDLVLSDVKKAIDEEPAFSMEIFTEILYMEFPDDTADILDILNENPGFTQELTPEETLFAEEIRKIITESGIRSLYSPHLFFIFCHSKAFEMSLLAMEEWRSRVNNRPIDEKSIEEIKGMFSKQIIDSTIG